MTFQAGKSHYDFRQPSLLGEAGRPTGANTQGNTFNQEYVDTGVTLTGIVAFDFLLKKPAQENSAVDVYAAQVRFVSGPSSGVKFITEYNNGGAWVPYDTFIA